MARILVRRMDKVHLGAVIRNHRKAMELTQAELAGKSGVALRIVVDIESGAGNPTLDTIEALAKVLSIPARELFPKPRAFSPLALDALDSTLDFLSKFQNLPEDAQMMIAVFLETDPALLDGVSVEFRAKWLQLLQQSLENSDRSPRKHLKK